MPLDFIHQLPLLPFLRPSDIFILSTMSILGGIGFDGQGQNLEAARMTVQILHQPRVVPKDLPDVMIDGRRSSFIMEFSVILVCTLGPFRLCRISGRVTWIGILTIVISRVEVWSDRFRLTNQEQSHKVQILEAHGGDMDGLQEFQTRHQKETAFGQGVLMVYLAA